MFMSSYKIPKPRRPFASSVFDEEIVPTYLRLSLLSRNEVWKFEMDFLFWSFIVNVNAEMALRPIRGSLDRVGG